MLGIKSLLSTDRIYYIPFVFLVTKICLLRSNSWKAILKNRNSWVLEPVNHLKTRSTSPSMKLIGEVEACCCKCFNSPQLAVTKYWLYNGTGNRVTNSFCSLWLNLKNMMMGAGWFHNLGYKENCWLQKFYLSCSQSKLILKVRKEAELLLKAVWCQSWCDFSYQQNSKFFNSL